MIHYLFNSEFSIYNLNQGNNLYIAIPKAFAKIIRQYLIEYKDLNSVPADRYVKGIELIDLGRNHYKLKNEFAQERNIPINQLRFTDL